MEDIKTRNKYKWVLVIDKVFASGKSLQFKDILTNPECE